MLQGTYSWLREKLNEPNLHIIEEYADDICYKEIQDKLPRIRAELLREIEPGRTNCLSSSVVDHLLFRMRWGNGLLHSEKTTNPHEQGQKHHRLVLNHVAKFVKDTPFLIVFVVFDWFGRITHDFADHNRTFYSSFTQELFCGYERNSTPFKNLNPKFIGTETVFDIIKKVSGILFLEDCSIEALCPDECNVNSFFYINPNADHKIEGSCFEPYARSLGNMVFERCRR
jgi:hypothetical protein